VGVPVLLLVGAPGSGKSSVLSAAYDLLAERGVPHAVLEDEHLSQVFPWDPASPLPDEALAAVWSVFLRRRVPRLVLTVTAERPSEVGDVLASLPGADPVVVGLSAPVDVLRERIEGRGEVPAMTEKLVAVAAGCADVVHEIGAAAVLDTTANSPESLAAQALVAARWIADDPSGS
jgi:chloramphenicol 3-O-phosphotransferase